MTSKRFKAVCTETGRESKPFGLSQKVRSNFRDPDVCVLMSDEFEMPRTDKDHAICQSTGLTDSRGQEVYEGDVLTTPSGSVVFSIEFFRDQFLGQNLDNKILSELSDIELLTVVGNKWMPQAELQARAEAVSNAERV